jgi:hypothetical protein
VLVVFPAVIVLAIAVPSLGLIDPQDFTDIPRGAWGVSTWLGLAIGFLPAVFMWLAIYKMCGLFALYHRGDPLAPQAGPLIKSIGSYLLTGALLAVAVVPAKTGLMSWNNPVGERSISIAVNSSTVGFILVAGLLLLIGWSMTEASKLAAENREFV